MLETKNLVRDRDTTIIEVYDIMEVYILPSLTDEEKLELIENCEYSVYSLFPSKGFGIEDLAEPDNRGFDRQSFETLDAIIEAVKPRFDSFGISFINDSEFSGAEAWMDYILDTAAKQWLGLMRDCRTTNDSNRFSSLFHSVWEHELLQRIIEWDAM